MKNALFVTLALVASVATANYMVVTEEKIEKRPPPAFLIPKHEPDRSSSAKDKRKSRTMEEANHTHYSEGDLEEAKFNLAVTRDFRYDPYSDKSSDEQFEEHKREAQIIKNIFDEVQKKKAEQARRNEFELNVVNELFDARNEIQSLYDEIDWLRNR